jgi:hypothetical protein
VIRGEFVVEFCSFVAYSSSEELSNGYNYLNSRNTTEVKFTCTSELYAGELSGLEEYGERGES